MVDADNRPAQVRLSLPKGRIELVYPQPAEDDGEAQKLFTHPLVLQYLPFWDPKATVDDIRARRESREKQPDVFMDMRIYHLPPHTPESTGLPKLMGTTGFLNMWKTNRTTEAGIIITPEAHRAGYASETLFILFDYAFKPVENGGLGMNRISMTTAAMNTAMRGWLEKTMGATLESTYREAWRTRDGAFIDATGYSVLRKDWFEGGLRARLLAKVEKAIAMDKGAKPVSPGVL